MPQEVFTPDPDRLTASSVRGTVLAPIARPSLLDESDVFSFFGFFEEAEFTFDPWRVDAATSFWAFEEDRCHFTATDLQLIPDEDLPADPGDITYRLSYDDGATFRYHDGASWVMATQPWHWNTLAEIDAFIASFAFADTTVGRRLTVRLRITPSRELTTEPTDDFDVSSSIVGDDLRITQVGFSSGVTFEVTTTGSVVGGTAISFSGTDPYTIVADIDPGTTPLEGGGAGVGLVDTINADPDASQLIAASRIAGTGTEAADTAVASVGLSAGVTKPRGLTTPALRTARITWDGSYDFEQDLRLSIGRHIQQNCRPEMVAIAPHDGTAASVILTTRDIGYTVESVVRVVNLTTDPGGLTNIHDGVPPTNVALPDNRGEPEQSQTIGLTSTPASGDRIKVVYLAGQRVDFALADALHQVSTIPSILVRVVNVSERGEFNDGVRPAALRQFDRQVRKDDVQDLDAVVEVQALGNSVEGVAATAKELLRIFRSRGAVVPSLSTGAQIQIPQALPASEVLDSVPFNLHNRRLTLLVAGYQWTGTPEISRAVDSVEVRVSERR